MVPHSSFNAVSIVGSRGGIGEVVGKALITESQATRNPLVPLKQAASARGEILPSYMEDFLISHEKRSLY